MISSGSMILTVAVGGDVHMTLAPYRGFWDMQSEVDRLFNDTVGDLLRTLRERWRELGLEGLAA
jgi:hypothetical protein